MPFPTDATGVIEGERACRQWGVRQAFQSEDRFADQARFTATPVGEYWCITHIEIDRAPNEALAVGAPAAFARHFRGSRTFHRAVSHCPGGECCRRPPAQLAERWRGRAWPAMKAPSYALAAVPAGTFPGVDLSEVYDFLDRHGSTAPP